MLCFALSALFAFVASCANVLKNSIQVYMYNTFTSEKTVDEKTKPLKFLDRKPVFLEESKKFFFNSFYMEEQQKKTRRKEDIYIQYKQQQQKFYF